MHVLHLPSWYPTHSLDPKGSFFRESAVSLAGIGVRVGVIAAYPRGLRGGTARTRHGAEMDEGVETLRTGFRTVFRFPRLHSKMRRGSDLALFGEYVERCGMPDIVHVQSLTETAQSIIEIRRRFHIPYVYSEVSTEYARRCHDPWKLRLLRAAAMGAERGFAISRPFAALLENQLELPEESVSVRPLAVHDDFLDGEIPPRQNHPFRFLHVSLLDSKKKVANIIRAFAREFPDDRSVELRIGGDGPDREACESLATQLGLAGRVHFLGMLDRAQVKEQMALCSAFVLASDHETLGVVLAEAMALGKPSIATRCGGPEDVITPGTGLLVPTGSIESLGRAMKSLVSDLGAYQPEHLRSTCRDRFGSRALASQWAADYELLRK